MHTEKEAKKQLEKQLQVQSDRMQQRLAERRSRSKAVRATSQINNQTLPLNFGNSVNTNGG